MGSGLWVAGHSETIIAFLSPNTKRRLRSRVWCSGKGGWALCVDECQGEAVVAFAAYGLEGGGGEVWSVGHEGEHGLGSLDGWILAAGVGDFSVADDVVGDDQGAGVGELESAGEVGGVVGLVGIDEDEVEEAFGVERGEGFKGGADADFDAVSEAGVLDVLLGDLGVARVEFKGDEAAAGWQGASQADGAVAAESADLEDATGVAELSEEVEHLALGGRDVDGGKACGCVGGEHGVQGGVGREESLGEVSIDGGPLGFEWGQGHGDVLLGSEFASKG